MLNVYNIYNHSRLKLTLLLLTQMSHLTVVDGGDSVVISGLDHLGHQLPLSGEGVELQDLIRVGGTVIVMTA